VTSRSARVQLAALFGGALLPTATQLAACLMLDQGYVRYRWLFYAIASVGAGIVGITLRTYLAASATACIAAGLLGAAFYKRGVQTGNWTELGNDYDWFAVLALGSLLIVGPACSRWLARRVK
jgi:hypothetical protein